MVVDLEARFWRWFPKDSGRVLRRTASSLPSSEPRRTRQLWADDCDSWDGEGGAWDGDIQDNVPLVIRKSGNGFES